EGTAFQGSLWLAERGVACGANGVALGELRAIEAEAKNWLGENAEGLRMADEAMSLLPERTAAWYAAAREALILANQVGATDRVIEIVGALEARDVDAEARQLRRMAIAWGAIFLIFAGELARAEDIVRELETGQDE